MSAQQEKLSKPFHFDPELVEDARQAIGQLSPEEQEALSAKTAYVIELLRQNMSPSEIVAELSKNDPLFGQAMEHLGRIPEMPMRKK
jgi:hypothetical protein